MHGTRGKIVVVGEGVHGHSREVRGGKVVVRAVGGAEKTHDKGNRVRLTREGNRIGPCPS